jgi:anti-sigma-K factor RskA
MIDERHEELAALYAFDLLEGPEKAAFETALARDPALRALVDELRETSATLAHTAPVATPPPELKARLLAEIGTPAKTASEGNVIAFPRWIPWAAAACFAFTAAWTGQLYFTSRSQADALRDQIALADLQVKSAQQQLEAERIVARQQIAGLNQQVTDATRQLADVTQRATTIETQLSANALRLAEANQKFNDAALQVASLNDRLSAAAREAGTLTQRQSELDRQLGAAKNQIASLERELKNQGDLANFKIATLASMLKNTPQALAVAVWNPAKQEGVVTVQKLPAAAADQDYELWLIDPQQPKPVSAGVIAVSADGESRATFKPESPVGTTAKFAISREKKGGAPAHSGPQGQVIMISQ